jgi:hypothetical protein
MEPAISSICEGPISEPIIWRVKENAPTSESALTAKKKTTQYVAVTCPPEIRFEAAIPNGFTAVPGLLYLGPNVLKSTRPQGAATSKKANKGTSTWNRSKFAPN